MTYEEALETKLRMCDICRNEAKSTKASCENCSDKVAIVAISKQIAKKPNEIYKDRTVKRGLCPNCLETVFSFDNYCHRCSQAQDWSDEE